MTPLHHSIPLTTLDTSGAQKCQMLRLVLNTLLCLKILLILKVGHGRVKSSTYSIALVLDGQLNIVMM